MLKKLTEMMLMVMLTMIRESRWTGTTLKFGLNIEQSLGAVWWRTTQVIRTPSPPTLSSTLATWRPKLFDGISLIWIWRSCEDIKSLFAPRSISGKVIPLGPWDLWGIYCRESGRLSKRLKFAFSETFDTVDAKTFGWILCERDVSSKASLPHKSSKCEPSENG